MRTPYIITIVVDKTDVSIANNVLEDLGFGANNFGIDCTSQFMFSAPLQQWEYNKVTSALDKSGIVYKLSEYVNDGNVKEKIMSTLKKEGLSIKIKVEE